MIATDAGFHAVVLDGALQESGMASFKGIVSPEQAEQIRAYLIARANEAKATQGAGRP
jgi:alcohol dehydrogenase (cytochrome c)/quinohemoprotein ethanol dehydrogenase